MDKIRRKDGFDLAIKVNLMKLYYANLLSVKELEKYLESRLNGRRERFRREGVLYEFKK